MKMALNRIVFEESDYKHPELEEVSAEFASFLYESSPYIFGLFTDFMRTSSNVNLSNYNKFIQKWFAVLIKNRRKAANDVLNLESLCKRFFSVCSSGDDIRKMRGLVPEKLFEIIFNKRHDEKKNIRIGYGVKVLIHGKPVLYRPQVKFDTDEDSDGDRQSVDAGFWDGNKAEFVEIKLQPHAFRSKDINYLRMLVEELRKKEIVHSIFLVSLANKDLIGERLQRLGVINNEVSNRFILIGRDELFDLEKSA